MMFPYDVSQSHSERTALSADHGRKRPKIGSKIGYFGGVLPSRLAGLYAGPCPPARLSGRSGRGPHCWTCTCCWCLQASLADARTVCRGAACATWRVRVRVLVHVYVLFLLCN
jgi:hypothetical protein